MAWVKSALLAVSVSLVASAAMAATASKSAQSLEDRRQAACYGDVQRLCGKDVPDVAKVTACMEGKRKLVSAPCSAMWDVTE